MILPTGYSNNMSLHMKKYVLYQLNAEFRLSIM